MTRVKQITIVGLGLIGGSLGMAIRRKRLAQRVVGLSRTAATLRQAKRLGAIDAGTTDAQRAVQGADLVILAGPVDTLVPQAKRLAKWMPAGSVLTDVGSTKGEIVKALEGTLPRRIPFVGAHPLAGSEQRGIGAARRDLFDGSVCVVTATGRTDRQALRRVASLWRGLARRVVVLTPDVHDHYLAAVSHLPHLLAFCLADITDSRALAIAPRSFLEATRVAKSDPDLWDDILLSNRREVVKALRRLGDRCCRVQSLLLEGQGESLRRFLRGAQRRRRTLCDD